MMDAEFRAQLERGLEFVDGAREALAFQDLAVGLDERCDASSCAGVREARRNTVIARAQDHFDILFQGAFGAIGLASFHRPHRLKNKQPLHSQPPFGRAVSQHETAIATRLPVDDRPNLPYAPRLARCPKAIG